MSRVPLERTIHALSGLGLLIASLLASCSNDSGATLYVSLRTDLVPGAEFGGVVVELAGHPEDVVVRRGTDFLRGQRVARFDGVERGEVPATLSLLNTSGILIERHFVVSIRGGTQTASIVVFRDCRGVVCPNASAPTPTACLGGVCIDPRCSVETPQFCPGFDDCSVASECGSIDSCSEAICDLGICMYGDGDCAEGSYCQPGRGCSRLLTLMPA